MVNDSLITREFLRKTYTDASVASKHEREQQIADIISLLEAA
jgi:hypothetical protein